MGKNLIVANWKMNPASKEEANNLFVRTKEGVKNANAEVVVCPPFVYLEDLNGMTLGAQNVFYQEKGAFTGEVSPAMLKNLGVEYVIIGHSERRAEGETDEVVNKKIKMSLQDGLKVIFCIGETQEQHDAGEKNNVLEHQINEGLKDLLVTDYQLQINIAYEPVWAIGTGNNCGTEDAKKMKEFIGKVLGENVLEKVRILYGGSVKSENSGAYIKEAGYNGLLVGGASLDPEEFIKIVRSA